MAVFVSAGACGGRTAHIKGISSIQRPSQARQDVNVVKVNPQFDFLDMIRDWRH